MIKAPDNVIYFNKNFMKCLSISVHEVTFDSNVILSSDFTLLRSLDALVNNER